MSSERAIFDPVGAIFEDYAHRNLSAIWEGTVGAEGSGVSASLPTGGATPPARRPLGKRGAHLVFEQACLFATNCELLHCPKSMTVQTVPRRGALVLL